MDSLIFQGPDALKAARKLVAEEHVGAFDLGPDFGQDTARIYLPSIQGGAQVWIASLENDRDVRRWFDPDADFRVLFDGPPFSSGGIPSVEGTPL